MSRELTAEEQEIANQLAQSLREELEKRFLYGKSTKQRASEVKAFIVDFLETNVENNILEPVVTINGNSVDISWIHKL